MAWFSVKTQGRFYPYHSDEQQVFLRFIFHFSFIVNQPAHFSPLKRSFAGERSEKQTSFVTLSGIL
jgi:hypothetical protein